MSGLATILVTDDERNIRRSLAIILAGEGYRVAEAESGEAALALAAEQPIDAVLLDLKLPGIDGLETLRRLHHQLPDLPVVVISGHGTIQDAVEAIRQGAFDFIEKPIQRERLLLTLGHALAQARLVEENRAHRRSAGAGEEILGRSPAIRQVLELIDKVAPTPGRVLVTGESGTGKELVARALHARSPRAAGPFIKVNCAAIPHELIESELFGHERGSFTGAAARRKGKFEQAHGGTLFLDEIGDMSPAAQAKVLRALETGEVSRIGGDETLRVDVRVVTATNKDLAAEIAAGRFREDLYFRLSVVPIRLPPLRERREDIELLAGRFLGHFAREYGLAPRRLGEAALETLRRAPWRGNVRELRNLMERLAILAGETIGPADLPAPAAASGAGAAAGEQFLDRLAGMTLRQAREELDRALIRARLEACGWNISQAARELDIERTNLHKRMRHYGIERT